MIAWRSPSLQVILPARRPVSVPLDQEASASWQVSGHQPRCGQSRLLPSTARAGWSHDLRQWPRSGPRTSASSSELCSGHPCALWLPLQCSLADLLGALFLSSSLSLSLSPPLPLSLSRSVEAAILILQASIFGRCAGCTTTFGLK